METLTGIEKHRDEKLFFCVAESLEHVRRFPEFEDESYQTAFAELKRMLNDFKVNYRTAVIMIND